MRTPFLITGSPSSGTRYMAACLSSYGAGLSVAHEMMGKHGMVSGLAAADDWYYLGKNVRRTSELGLAAVIEQVRHPLSVIPTLAVAMKPNFWHWQEKHTGIAGDMEPVIRRAALYWLRWQDVVAVCRPEWRFRIEDIATVWPELLDRLELPQGELPVVSATYQSSGAVPLTWDELKRNVDADACEAIYKRAAEYGYV